MSLTKEQITKLAAECSVNQDSYREFVANLTSDPKTYNLSGEVLFGLLEALQRLTPASLELDHFKRVMTYGDKLRINPPFVGWPVAPVVMAAAVGNLEGTPLTAGQHARLLLIHGLLGKLTEALELVPLLANAIARDELDVTNLMEELGDDAFYTALVEQAAGLTPGDVVRRNVHKLGNRYKGGRFTRDEALNRDLERERAALETAKEVN